MAKNINLTVEEIGNILKSKKFNAFVGKIENEYLECKQTGYNLSDESQKIELAKDISSFANLNGGYLLLGVTTSRKDTSTDRITKINYIKRSDFDKQRYINVIREYVYPDLRVDITEHPKPKDKSMILVAIRIPLVNEQRRPFLVAKLLSQNAKKNTIQFGYVERKFGGNVPRKISDIHALLTIGADREKMISEINQLRNLSLDIQKDIYECCNQRKPISSEEGAKKYLEDRVLQALEAVSLSNKPAYILTAYPKSKTEVNGLFGGSDSKLLQLLLTPPKTRDKYGFNYQFYNRHEIGYNGEYQRNVVDSYVMQELWLDGTLIVIFTAGEEYLSWGSYRESGGLIINQVVLVESILDFVKLSSEIYNHHIAQRSENVVYNISLRSVFQHNEPVKLAERHFDYFLENRNYPNARDLHENVVKFPEIPADITVSPTITAANILKSIYRVFGVEEDSIPLTTLKDSGLEIDEQEIRNLDR